MNILICGLQETGKTTLSKRISKDFKFKYINDYSIFDLKNENSKSAIVDFICGNDNYVIDLCYSLTPSECSKLNCITYFLGFSSIEPKVFMDYDHKRENGQQASVLTSLASWILHNIKPATDEKFVQTNKFNRTAEEIWKSGLATGYTDYCTVFATLARQLKIPTTFLHTAEYSWLMKLNAGESLQKNIGHSFCECYCDGKWVLVDPTCGKVIENYNQNIISLPYQVGGSTKFVPYYRALDLGGKQTIKDHNQDMNEKCKNLFH